MDPKTNFLRRHQVEARTGLRRSTIYDKIKRGRFPAPIHIDDHIAAWIDTEIDTWIAERISASRPKPAQR